MTAYGGCGGVWGGRPPNPDDLFEMAVERAMGERLRSGEQDLGNALWGSLANCSWSHENGDTAGYSFRAAGDLIAAICGRGDYMDWYCSSPEGVVDPEVAELMAPLGWTGRPD